jgi:hypothetical protein
MSIISGMFLLLTKHQNKPTSLPSKITTLAPILVIVIVAIVYLLYQDNRNISLFDELWLIASPTHSNSYRSIVAHLKIK